MNLAFRKDLLKSYKLLNVDMRYDQFKETFMQVLDCYAPKKTKIVRGNNEPFMNKVLSKAFMHRSKLKNRL